MPAGTARPVVVLVHGGFLGPWIWSDVVKILDKSRIKTVCPDLPSMGRSGQTADLYDDARAVREVIDSLGHAVLCGHSYGGAVITEAAAPAHPAVRHLVYLTAAVPDTGDSLASLASRHPAPGGADDADEEELERLPDGRVTLRRDSARTGLFHDCPPERADVALSLLRPANPVVNAQLVHGAAWRSIPATYVRGEQDRLPRELLAPGFLERAEQVITLPTGHCPQWSRPDLVAGLLAEIATRLSQRWDPVALSGSSIGQIRPDIGRCHFCHLDAITGRS